MSESTPGKIFNIPRIKRLVSKDNLSSTNLDSRDALELEATVNRSFLDQNYNGSWKLQAVQLINNKELEEEYRLKRQELKDESRHARDLVDQFAFMAMRNESIVPKIAKEGLKARPNFLSILGDSSNGVHLCRHADVQLRVADAFATNTCKIVVFRVILGKCKAFQPSYEKCATYEPTPNYDCHVSVHPAQSRDSFIHQLSHSQVFFYEYTDEAVPSNRPRQCLPHAVLTYTKTKGSGKVELTSYGTAVKAYVPVKDKYQNQTLSREGSKPQDSKADQQNTLSKKPLLSIPEHVQAHRTALANQLINIAQPNQAPSKVVVQKTRADPRCALKQRRESDDSSLNPNSVTLNIDGANEGKSNRPNISSARPAGAFHRTLSEPEFLTPPNQILTRSPKILSASASEVKNRSPKLSPGISPHANSQESPSSFIVAYNTRHIGLNETGNDPSRVHAPGENPRQQTRSQEVNVVDPALYNPDSASKIKCGLSVENQISATSATYDKDEYGSQNVYPSDDDYRIEFQFPEKSENFEQRRRMHEEHPRTEGDDEMYSGYQGSNDYHSIPRDQPFHNDLISDNFSSHIHYQSEVHRPGYDEEESNRIYNSTRTMPQWQSPEKEKVQSPFGIAAQDMDYRKGPFGREVDTDYRSMYFANDVDMRRSHHTAPQHEAILGSGDVDYRMLGMGKPHPSTPEFVGHDSMNQEGKNLRSDPSQEHDELRWSSPYSINMAAALSPFITSSPESVKQKASPKAMRGKLVCSIPPAPSTSTSESILQYTCSVAGVRKNLSDTSFEDDMDVCTSDSDVDALKNKTKDTFYSLNSSSDTENRQEIAYETDVPLNASLQSTDTSLSEPTVPKFDSDQLKDLIADINVPKFDSAQLKELIDDTNVSKFDGAQLKDLIDDINVPKFDSTQLKELISNHPDPSEQNVSEPVIDNSSSEHDCYSQNISDTDNAQSQNLINNDVSEQKVPKFDSAQLKELVCSGFVLNEPKVPKFDTAQLKNLINTVDMTALKNIVAKCQGDSDGDGGACKETAKKLDNAYKIVAGVKTKYNYVVKKKRSQSNESSVPISVSQNKVTDETVKNMSSSDCDRKDGAQKFEDSENKMPSPIKIPVHTISAECQPKKMEARERSDTFGWIDQTLVKRQLDQIKNVTDVSSSDTESFPLSESAMASDVDVSKDELVTHNIATEDNRLLGTAVDQKKSSPKKCNKNTTNDSIFQTKEATVYTSDSDDLYDKPLVIIEQDCDISTSQEVDSSSESQRLSQGDATRDDKSEVLDENSKRVNIDIGLRKKKRKNPSMMGYKTRKKKRKRGANVDRTTEITVKSKERGGSEKTPKPDSDSVKKSSTKCDADKTDLNGTKFREVSSRSFLDTLGAVNKDTKPDDRSENDEEMVEIDYNDFSFDQPFDCFESIPDCLPLSDPQNSYEDISDAEAEQKESLNNGHPQTTVFERTLSQTCYEDISDEDDVGKSNTLVIVVNESVTKNIGSNVVHDNDKDESLQNKLTLCEQNDVDGATNVNVTETAKDSHMEICSMEKSSDSLQYQTAVEPVTATYYEDLKMDQTVQAKSTVVFTNNTGFNTNSELASTISSVLTLSRPLMQSAFTVPLQRKEVSLVPRMQDSRLDDWTDAAKDKRFQPTVVVCEQKCSTSPEAFIEPDTLNESRTMEEQHVVENVAKINADVNTESYLNEKISIGKTEPVIDVVHGNHTEIVTDFGNDNTLQQLPHETSSNEKTLSLLSMDPGPRLPITELRPLMSDDKQSDQQNSSKQIKSNDIKILTSINKMKPNFLKKPYSKSRKRPSFKGIAQAPRHRVNTKNSIDAKDSDEVDAVEKCTSTTTSLSTDIIPLGDPAELVESGNERDKDYVARREIKLTLITSVKQNMLSSQKVESTPTKDTGTSSSEMKGSPIPVLDKLDSPVTTMSVSKLMETKVSVPETTHTITTVGSSIPVLGQAMTPAVLPKSSGTSISFLHSSQPATVSPVVAGSCIPVLQYLGSSETQTPSLPPSQFVWQPLETTNWSASSHAFQPIHDNSVPAGFDHRSLMPPVVPPFQLQAPPMSTPEQPYHFAPVCAPPTSAIAMPSLVMHPSIGLPFMMQTPTIGHPAMERMLHQPPPVITTAPVSNLQLIVTNPPPPICHTLAPQYVISAPQNLLHGTNHNQGLSPMGPSHDHLPLHQASKLSRKESNVIDWFADKITPKHSTNIVVVSGEERPNSTTNDEDEEIQAINTGLHVTSRASSLQRDDSPPKSPGTPLMEERRTPGPGTPLMEERSTPSPGTPLMEEGSTPSPGTPLMEEGSTSSPGTPLIEEDRTPPRSLTRSPRERNQFLSDAKDLNLLSQARHQLLRELETIGSDSGDDDVSVHSEESHQSPSRSRSRVKLPREDIYYRTRSKSNSSASSCQSQKGIEDGEITDGSSTSTPSGDIEPDEYQIEPQSSTDYHPIPTIGSQAGMSRRVPEIGFTWSRMITKKPGNITRDNRFSDGLELSPSDLFLADTSETIQGADIIEELVHRKPSPVMSSNSTPVAKREESADLSNVALNPKIISQIVDNINIYQVTIGEWMRTVVGNNDQLLHIIEDLLPYPKDQYMAGLSKNRRRTLKKRVKERLLEVFSKQMKPTDNEQNDEPVTAGPSDSCLPSSSGMQELSISPDLDTSDKASEGSATTTQSTEQKPSMIRGLMDDPVHCSTPPPMNEPSAHSLSFLGPGLIGDGPASKEMLADVMMEYLNYLKFRPVAEGNIHEKVPRELLMPVEFTSMFSMEGVFLVLSCLIPKRPYERLLTLRSSLIFVEQEMNQCGLVPSPHLISLVNRKNDIHMRRKGLLSNFTGTVSFKHLRKLESQRNCYAFCSQQPLVQSEHGFITFVNHNLRAVCNHIEVVEMLLRSASHSRCPPSITI